MRLWRRCLLIWFTYGNEIALQLEQIIAGGRKRVVGGQIFLVCSLFFAEKCI